MRLLRLLFNYQRWGPFRTLSEELSARFAKAVTGSKGISFISVYFFCSIFFYIIFYILIFTINIGTAVESVDSVNTKEVEILVALYRLQSIFLL